MNPLAARPRRPVRRGLRSLSRRGRDAGAEAPAAREEQRLSRRANNPPNSSHLFVLHSRFRLICRDAQVGFICPFLGGRPLCARARCQARGPGPPTVAGRAAAATAAPEGHRPLFRLLSQLRCGAGRRGRSHPSRAARIPSPARPRRRRHRLRALARPPLIRGAAIARPAAARIGGSRAASCRD